MSDSAKARDAVVAQDLDRLRALMAQRGATDKSDETPSLPYSLIVLAANARWEAGVDVLVQHSSSNVVGSALFRLLSGVKTQGEAALPALELVLKRARGQAQHNIIQRFSIQDHPQGADLLDRIWDDLADSARQVALIELARGGAWEIYRRRWDEALLETSERCQNLLLAMMAQADTVPLDLFQAAYDSESARRWLVLKEAARDGHNRLVSWMLAHAPQEESWLVEATQYAGRYEQPSTVALLLEHVSIQAVTRDLARPDQLETVDAMGCGADADARAWLLTTYPDALPRTEAYHRAEMRQQDAQAHTPTTSRNAPRRRS